MLIPFAIPLRPTAALVGYGDWARGCGRIALGRRGFNADRQEVCGQALTSYASKNGHEAVVKLVCLRRDAVASAVWFPRIIFLFPNPLEDGDIVSCSISMPTCSDTACQPPGVYGFTSLAFPISILFLLRYFRTLFLYITCRCDIRVDANP